MSVSSSLEEGEIPLEEGEVSCPQGPTHSPSRSFGLRNVPFHLSLPALGRQTPQTVRPSRESSPEGVWEPDPNKEIEDLTESIYHCTRAVGLQDCLKNLRAVCDSLDRALSKAYRLYKLLSKRDSAVRSAEDSSELAKAGVRILNGLRSLHVFSTTGQGRDMLPAQDAVRAAWHDRKLLFTAGQRKQLEGWMRSSRSLAALLPRDAGLNEPAQPSSLQPPPAAKSVLPSEPKPAPASKPAAGPAPPPSAKQQQQPAVRTTLPPPPPPAASMPQPSAAPSGTSGPTQQPVTTSVGDKRSHASDEDSHSSSSRSNANKRSRRVAGQAAASQPLPPVPPPVPAELQPVEAQLTAPAVAAPAPPAVPANSDGSSMDLSDSPGPLPSTAAAPGTDPASASNGVNEAGPRGQHAESAPAAAVNLFHGVLISEDVRGLLGRGKLCLVLDLDHTLLNSARYSEVDPGLQERLEKRCSMEQAMLPEQERLLFRMDDIKMWTKLRPGVRQFLKTALQHYELWIHTNGNKTYAAAVTKLLDPSGELFGQRVIAQGADRVDEMQADQAKSFMQGLEGREAVTVIVDDSHSVWAQHKRNLVVVERYVYFPSSRLQLGISRPSLLEANRDECFEQGMLPTALDVLLRVHKRVAAAVSAPPLVLPGGETVYANWDVRQALGEERQAVLRGVVVLFSRVFPLDRRPETHPLWQMAEAFGARCVKVMDAGVTHVVAAAGGTEKVMQARQRGLYVVTPGWLECSCILWKRATEERFSVLP